MGLPILYDMFAECRGSNHPRHEICPNWCHKEPTTGDGYREIRCACRCHRKELTPLAPDAQATVNRVLNDLGR